MNEALRKRLLEPGFRYVKHDATDIRVLFARVRAELAAKQANNVKPLKERRHG